MSFVAKGLYLAYALNNFTKQSYRREARNFNEDLTDYDLSDKRILVTGGSRGIGYASCLYFATQGAEVHYICTSDDTGIDSLEDMKSVSGNDRVFYHVVDLCDLKQMRRFAEDFRNEFDRIDVLVHNAGNLFNERCVNEFGLDLHFVVNALSGYFLTMSFLDLLKKCEDPRVIFVSSGAMLTEKLYVGNDFHQKIIYSPLIAYARSKKIQVALCERFGEIFSDIKFFSMHPGWVETESIKLDLPIFYKSIKSCLKTIEQGADTICWLAVSNRLTVNDNGKFYRDRKEEIKNFYFSGTDYKPYEVDLLWNWCKELTKWDRSDKFNFNNYSVLLQSRMPVVPVTYGFKTVKHCFLGSEAADVIKRETNVSEDESMTNLQKLIEDRYVRFASKKQKFFAPELYLKMNNIPPEEEIRKHVSDAWISNIMKYVDMKGENSDWVVSNLCQEENTNLYTRTCPDHNVLSVKLSTTLQCKKKQLDDILINNYLLRQSEWSPSYSLGYVLEEIDKNLQIQYWKYNIGWNISPRDFLVVRRILDYDGGVLIVDRSIKYGKQKKIPGVIRSHLYFQMRYYKELDNGLFSYTSCNETDVKGWIPKKLMSLSAIKVTLSEESALLLSAKRKRSNFY